MLYQNDKIGKLLGMDLYKDYELKDKIVLKNDGKIVAELLIDKISKKQRRNNKIDELLNG